MEPMGLHSVTQTSRRNHASPNMRPHVSNDFQKLTPRPEQAHTVRRVPDGASLIKLPFFHHAGGNAGRYTTRHTTHTARHTKHTIRHTTHTARHTTWQKWERSEIMTANTFCYLTRMVPTLTRTV